MRKSKSMNKSTSPTRKLNPDSISSSKIMQYEDMDNISPNRNLGYNEITRDPNRSSSQRKSGNSLI